MPPVAVIVAIVGGGLVVIGMSALVRWFAQSVAAAFFQASDTRACNERRAVAAIVFLIACAFLAAVIRAAVAHGLFGAPN